MWYYFFTTTFMALPPWLSEQHEVSGIKFFLQNGKSIIFHTGKDGVKRIHLLIANGEVHIEGDRGNVRVFVGVTYTALLEKRQIVLPNEVR